MDLPIQISTNKEKYSKRVQIDGYTYMVRRPGAGESLTYRELGREMTKLESKTELTATEQEVYEEMRARSSRISLNLFDALGNAEAKEYVDSLPLQTLLASIAQIFGEAEIDEPAPTVS